MARLHIGALSAAILISGIASAQGQYEPTQILANGEIVDVQGLAGDGYVTGNLFDQAAQRFHGVRWHNGAAEVLEDWTSGPGGGAFPIAINSVGVVVGEGGVTHFTAAAWDGQGVHNLGTLGGIESSARAVNGNGWIVGGSYLAVPGSRGFLYRSGEMQNLGNLGIPNAIYGIAIAVNSSGLVIGYDQDSGETTHFYGWYWTESSGIVQIPSLHVPKDLNDLGEILSGNRIWTIDGQSRTLPNATELHGLNNLGQVVGISTGSVPSLWNGQTRYNLQDLISPSYGYTMGGVLDINDNGQILAYGDRGGVTYSLLLNPVPEPTTLSALGIALVAARRRTRRS
jgi:probable HAF family extracellular repeat protein